MQRRSDCGVTPEIPPRTIACHTCCETLRRPPNWLAAARELALRRCMLQENGDQIVEDFLHNLGPVRHRERTAQGSVQPRTPEEQSTMCTEEGWCPIPERRKRPPFGPSRRTQREWNRLCNTQEVIGPEQRTTNWRFIFSFLFLNLDVDLLSVSQNCTTRSL